MYRMAPAIAANMRANEVRHRSPMTEAEALLATSVEDAYATKLFNMSSDDGRQVQSKEVSKLRFAAASARLETLLSGETSTVTQYSAGYDDGIPSFGDGAIGEVPEPRPSDSMISYTTLTESEHSKSHHSKSQQSEITPHLGRETSIVETAISNEAGDRAVPFYGSRKVVGSGVDRTRGRCLTTIGAADEEEMVMLSTPTRAARFAAPKLATGTTAPSRRGADYDIEVVRFVRAYRARKAARAAAREERKRNESRAAFTSQGERSLYLDI